MSIIADVIAWRRKALPRDYYSIPGTVMQDDLEQICRRVNQHFKLADSPLRVCNSMGEILPTAEYQRMLPWT